LSPPAAAVSRRCWGNERNGEDPRSSEMMWR
jgi:hypothetical protein